MKLSPQAVEQTLNQFEAQALPENHPVVPKLNRLFGEHTYFLDSAGLHIIEPARKTDSGKLQGVESSSPVGAMRIARLAPHPPEWINLVVVLEAA
jgi:hypothetical protein